VEASDLSFKKYSHVKRLLSSTTVKKYLKPSIEGVDKGPHISIWTISKVFAEIVELLGKGKRFCLA
jgi:hypothetical protein